MNSVIVKKAYNKMLKSSVKAEIDAIKVYALQTFLKVMEAKKISFKDLAEKLDVHQACVSRTFNKGHKIRLETLLCYCEVLGLKLNLKFENR